MLGAKQRTDALLQSIGLAAAAEEYGADEAYFRLRHFARRLASPFPPLAAVGVRMKKTDEVVGWVRREAP